MTAAQAARRFVERINAHDVDGIAGLLSDDHRFIDSLGNVFVGRATLERGWRAYFAMVPDYTIDVAAVVEDGPAVVLVGTAHGTYSPGGELRSGGRWSTPAAFRARVCDGLVTEWQVYADNEPIRQLMAKAAD